MSGYPSDHNQNKFHGNINEDMTLTDIFQTLGVNQQHGWLFLRYLDQEICLYFQGDLVGLVTPPQEKLSFISAKLFYADKLSQDQYEEVENSEAPLEKLSTLVAEEELNNILNTICYEEICNTFSWPQGYFEFISHNHPEANPNLVPLGRLFEVEGVLMEVAQRQQESDEILAMLPPPDEILVHANPLDMECLPDDPMGNIWNLAHHRSIKEIVLLSFFSEFDTYRILSTLLQERNLAPINGRELMDQAQSMEKQGNLEAAANYYQLLLVRNPMDLGACDALAHCYERINQIEALAELYKTTGERLVASQNFQERNLGGSYLRKFYELFPESAEAVEARVGLFFEVINQKIDSKEIEYNPILEGKKLFQLLRSRKDDDRARQILEILLKITPHDKSLQSHLINVCLDLQDIPSAVAQYESIAKIYERDKNWDELIATYQKIVRLAPERKDIQKKLDSIESRKNRGKKLVVRAAILLAVCLLGLSGWYGYSLYVTPPPPPRTNGSNVKNPLPHGNQKTPDIKEALHKKAKEKLKSATTQIEAGKLEMAQQTLKDILLITSLPEAIIQETKSKLQNVESLIKQRDETLGEFNNSYARAQNLEKQGQCKDAILIYLALWRNKRFKKIARHRDIRLPLQLKVIPSGASVLIDNKKVAVLAGKDFKLLHCHPDFQSLTISLPSYESVVYYNAFQKNNSSATEGAIPLNDSKIETTLKKKILWKIDITSRSRSIVDATPSYINGVLFLAARDDHLYSFQGFSKNSKPRYAAPPIKLESFSSFSASPVYYRSVLYLGGTNGLFYAIYPPQQKVVGLYNRLFKKARIDEKAAISEEYKLLIFCAISYGSAYAGRLYALPLLRKSVGSNWPHSWYFLRQNKMNTAPVIHGRRVFIGCDDGYLYCLDIERHGKIIWGYRIGTAVTCAPAIDGKLLYIIGNNQLRAVKIDSGREQWTVPVRGDVVGQPLLHQDILYFGTSSKKVYAASVKQRGILWSYDGIAPFKATPAISVKKGIVYIGSDKGYAGKKNLSEMTARLYAFDAQTGSLRWYYPFSKDLRASPVLINDIVVQVADKIYCFIDG